MLQALDWANYMQITNSKPVIKSLEGELDLKIKICKADDYAPCIERNNEY